MNSYLIILEFNSKLCRVINGDEMLRIISTPQVSILISAPRQSVDMNDEDADWKLYHLIPDEGIPVDDLIQQSGMTRDEVLASAARLEKIRLVQCSGDVICPLSINDFLIASTLCGCSSSKAAEPEDDFGIYIENGVIKVRK